MEPDHRGDLAAQRQAYEDAGLSEDDLDPDPIEQFGAWYEAWRPLAVGEPDAVVLATATPDGRPSARTVILRGIVDGGFVFYTNYESRKGEELTANPRATLVFSWHPVGRQVTVEGAVERVGPEMSDAYWATRPPGSRRGSAASPQSRVVSDRGALERRVEALVAKHPDGDVPRPSHWGGYRLVPARIELWQGRQDRVHDRFAYRRTAGDPTTWHVERLAP